MLRNGLCLCIAFVGVTPSGASAQTKSEPPNTTTGSPALLPDAVPGVNQLLSPPTNTLVTAAISGAPAGSQYRATFTPARAFDSSYIELLSESKFTATYDSKSSLTTIGYGLAYNPFSFRGARINSIVAKSKHDAGCGGAYATATPGLSAALSAQAAAEDAIKLHIAAGLPPFVIANDMATLEIAKRKADAISAGPTKVRQDCENKHLAGEWALIYHGWIPYVAANIAINVFQFGQGPDPTNPALSLPLEPWGGVSANLEFLFRPHERVTLDLWGSYKNTRPSGAPRTQLSNSYGGGITLGVLVWGFLSADKLAESSEYLNDGFIPGIALGASGQYLHCDGGPYCDSGKVNDFSVTPFLDIRVKEALQFRISFPIERFMAVSTTSGTSVAPTLTIAGTIASL